MKRRILSIITALALCLSLCPTWALAAEADPALCPHHREHTEDCGYTAPAEGQPCGHQHTAECYTLGVLPDADGGDYYEIGADTENLLDCRHSHDSECGYVQADPGAPCGYVCRICPIEDLIAALPEHVTADNAADVRAQLDRILDLYRELNEDEQEEIDLSRATELQGALDGANAPMAADGSTEQQDTDEASVTINEETLYYATLEEAFAAANGQTSTITMLTDAECVHSDSNGSPLNINGGNVTLNLNGKTLSGKGSGYYGIINVSGGSLLVQGEEGKVNVTMTGLSCRGSGKLTVEGITLELVGDNIGVANAGVENSGGTVVLNGTQITGAASDGQIYHYSGTTTINNVTATGTTENHPKSVWYCNEGTLTINGGTFDKIVVESGNGGGVQSVAELLGEGYTYKKQGGAWATADDLAAMEISNVTVAKIPLTIHPQGDTSWYYSTQQTHTLVMNAAPVDSGNSVSYVWKNGEETLDCTSDAYTVPAGMPVGSYTYTCEATCDGYTLSHTFTFKIEKSGTDLTSEGKVLTYNGETQTDTFTAGDTITVKATPTPTGDAPQKAAARLRGDPTAGQMAVFVGDTQVSAPADKGADGAYTMTVSAADVLVAAGGPGTGITLTAKFVGNNNMADAAGTATVNITAVAVAEKDGKVIGYYGESNLDDAFTNDGATVTLLADVKRANTLTIKANCTLDLGGHNITFTGTENAWVQGSVTTMTIRGEGEIVSEQSYALVVSGSVTLEGGTFTSNGGNSAGVYVNSDVASLSVTGEYVTIRNTGGGYGLAVNYAQSVQLSAGTYKGEKAVSIVSGTTTLGDLLNQEGASRVAYYKDNTTLVTEGLDGQTLPGGSYTVKACTHIFGSSTTCPACGGEAVARVTIGGAVTHYGDLPSAWAAVQGQTADLYLLKSVDAAGVGRWGRLDLASGSVTLGMADGVVLSGSSSQVIKMIGGELTLNSGTIRNNGTTTIPTGLQVSDGTLRISGGTVEANWAVYINGGHAEITGGTFTATGEYSVGLRKDEGTVKISGGQFSGSLYAVYNSNGTLADLLAEDYAFKQGGAWVTDTSGDSLTGTVTAEPAPVKITAQPIGDEVTYGESAALSVMAQAANSEKPVTYQWYQVGENGDTAVAGATAASYTASGLGAGTYQYYCTVTCDSYTVKSATAAVTVKPRQLTPTITGTATKTYDGTTGVASGQLSITLTGVVTGDTVTASATSYAYDNANAGESKTITASGITLGGADAGNYELSSTTATTTGTITKSQPTIAFAGDYNPSKTYDGQTISNPTADDLTITGAAFGNVDFTWYAGNVDEANKLANPPKDAGTYTLTASIPVTNNTEAASATLTVTISSKAVTADSTNITLTPSEYEFSGTERTPEVVIKDGETVIPADEYTVTYSNNINVGTATVTITDKTDGNYTVSGSTTFQITKVHQAALSITQKPTSIKYGDTFTLGIEGGSGEGAVTWSVTGPATVSATGEVKITGVGSVTVKAVKAGGNDYEDAEATLTFEAAKKPVTATVTAANKTYDGSTSATVTASVNNTDLVTGDSITITGVTGTFDNANAGTDKTVTVDGTGASISGTNADKYQVAFPASTTADIEKANASIATAPAGKTGLTYTGAAQALVTAGTASVGEVVYSLTETGTYSTTIPTGTNAGSYTVWYKIADTDNYNGTTPVKVDVTISKVDYIGEKAGSTSGKFGMTKTYDLKNLLPEGYVLGIITTTDTNGIFEVTPTVSGTVLTYKLADSAEAGKTGTITIPVTESTNYNSFDLTITVTVTNVRIPDLTVNPISMTYTGNPVNSNQITGTARVDGDTVLGTWSFAEGQALTNVADSGPKSVVFSPTNTGEYGPATGTVTVTITKATPSLSLTPSPATLPNGGTVTLTLSGLPSGGSATVTCSDANITVTKGSGNTWTADLPAGGASYTFTASYSGDGNHNGATASCIVSVEKITPTLSLTACPTSLRGGGTVTLTLSGLPAGGTAAVTCDRGITVTAGAGSTWTATLPNSTATYTFMASYAGSASYNAASASCTVETSEVTVLPNPPAAEDGKQYQVVMEDGISEVPVGLQSIETLNTPEKLETAMKTAITQANSGVPQDNTAVYDVELQISDNGGATWTKATAANFPANGLTVTLPYPAGTNSGYTFTVVHMFTTSDFNKTPGDTETPRVTNTASGLRFTVTGLSPISVGWVQPSTPTTPTGPTGGGGGGGGWSSSTYAVTVERAEHGKVTSNRTNASSGSTVTLTVTPDTGYVLDTLTVTDSRGSEIKLTAQGGGKYTFTMPSRAVTVKAAFAPLPDDRSKPCDGGVDCPSHGFTDLGTVGTWYHEAVDYVLRNNLMGGYGNGLFGPNDTLTRAQFAQILFNKEGRPVVNYLLQYGDVATGAWYTEAVRWATSQGIVGGYGNGTFGPNDNITREQLAVMLWRYAGSPAATDKELHFTDADQASGFALEALRWAVENGILNGYGDGRLGPQGLATRAQVAQMLMNFLKDE